MIDEPNGSVTSVTTPHDLTLESRVGAPLETRLETPSRSNPAQTRHARDMSNANANAIDARTNSGTDDPIDTPQTHHRRFN